MNVQSNNFSHPPLTPEGESARSNVDPSARTIVPLQGLGVSEVAACEVKFKHSH